TAQYVISVWNPGRDGEFDSQLRRWIVLPLGGPADSVTVLDMLDADTPVLSVSATNDFVCWPAGSVVTCRGGNVPKGGYAQILITVAMSARDRTATNSAVVDPSNAI